MNERRSMPPRPRYHSPGIWTRERGEDIRAAARTLVRLLGAEPHQDEWRDGGWKHSQPWSQRNGPGPFSSTSPAGRFGNPPDRQRWRPEFRRNPTREETWQQTSGPVPRRVWRSHAMPRRGPPVAVMKVPRWYPRDVGNERGPRGFKPRGSLRGGPERPASDPQKKPRGGPWRGPERSAKEPRTQRKPTQRETDEEDQGERKKAKWPTD